jgi:hypothetical protein
MTAAVRAARESRNRTLDLAGVAHVYWPYVHPDRRRYGLDYGELAYAGGYVGIPNDRRSGHAAPRFSRWPRFGMSFSAFALSRTERASVPSARTALT